MKIPYSIKYYSFLSKVEVVVEADPERMMSYTESWKSQLLNAQEFGLQKPLFAINTYTDKQVRHKIYHPLTQFETIHYYKCSMTTLPFSTDHNLAPYIFIIRPLLQLSLMISSHLH